MHQGIFWCCFKQMVLILIWSKARLRFRRSSVWHQMTEKIIKLNKRLNTSAAVSYSEHKINKVLPEIWRISRNTWSHRSSSPADGATFSSHHSLHQNEAVKDSWRCWLNVCFHQKPGLSPEQVSTCCPSCSRHHRASQSSECLLQELLSSNQHHAASLKEAGTHSADQLDKSYYIWHN